MFGKNPGNPPHLIKPIYFSAVLWKEHEVPELNNKTITLKSLEKILQDIGRLINPQILNEEFMEISKSKSLIKTYQKILRLIEKLYGNLDSISDLCLTKEELFTLQNINGISRKAKQLDKTYKKWFKLEIKNEKSIENLIA